MEEKLVQSYVVRVYRRSPVDKGSVSGILEDIDSGQKESFHSLNELQSMLSHSIGKDQLGCHDLAPQELDTHKNITVIE